MLPGFQSLASLSRRQSLVQGICKGCTKACATWTFCWGSLSDNRPCLHLFSKQENHPTAALHECRQMVAPLKLVVKKTAGGAPFSVHVEPEISISELKSEVSKHADIPAEEQRLIYKGQASAVAGLLHVTFWRWFTKRMQTFLRAALP